SSLEAASTRGDGGNGASGTSAVTIPARRDRSSNSSPIASKNAPPWKQGGAAAVPFARPLTRPLPFARPGVSRDTAGARRGKRHRRSEELVHERERDHRRDDDDEGRDRAPADVVVDVVPHREDAEGRGAEHRQRDHREGEEADASRIEDA